jgi:YidC/Oxa1 family membrane protein insertase
VAARTWIAVVLCCLVWFVYARWFAPPMTPPPASVPAATSSAPAADGTAAPVAGTSVSGFFGTPFRLSSASNLDTAKLELGFSDVGGKVATIRVPHYRETVKTDSPPITLVSPALSEYALGTLFTDPALVDFGKGKYDVKSDAGKVVFDKTGADGVRVEKRFAAEENSYLFDSEMEITFPANAKKDWGYLIVPVGARDPKYDAQHPLHAWEVVTFQGDSVTRKITDKLDPGERLLQGNTGWLAFGNRYFATALVNKSEINPDVIFYKDPSFTGGYLRYPLALKEGQKSLKFAWRVYAGPKEPAELGKVPGLKQLIEYGIFTALAYPLLETLKFFYRFVHNYGLAIILLTLLVRAAFYPLSVKSFRSMKAMQKLQPQITALKEKYGDDKERFSREQLALFKAHKVNPAGGCLPMFVQLPVFIALYAVLGNSIELFHAPFFGWIQDLSSKDPFYIFPILMGISMVLQQKLTPMVGMDPMQQKMMMFMPIFFTFLMINLPSGLTVYMFVSTLVGILQQYLLSKERNADAAKVLAAQAPEKG